jgi:hypothetical protein
MIDPTTNEAIAKESFYSDIDVAFATKATLKQEPVAFNPKETFVFNPSQIPGATETEIATERSSKPENPITSSDYAKADRIVEKFFDRILDPEIFFDLVNLDFSAFNRHDREKFLQRMNVDTGSKSAYMSYAFGKNETSKKQVVLNEGAKLKLLAVLGMPPAQLLLFDELVESLAKCFCFSLRPGIVTPFMRTKMEINGVLGAFEGAFELDLERQDQSHDRIHVAIFLRFVEMVAKRRGMSDLVEAIRISRRVRSLSGIVIFLQGCGLGSGDSWTLISNMIMAFSTLISRYDLPRGCYILQVGDDITCSKRLQLRDQAIVHFKKAKFKVDDHMDVGRPNFTSRTAINDESAIPTRIRGIVSAGYKKRSAAAHRGYKTSLADFIKETSQVGIAEFAFIHANLWRGDKYESETDALENIIGHTIKIVNTPFEDLPACLQAQEPEIEVFSSRTHCFANALARSVDTNVQAHNIIADQYRYADVKLSECVRACEAHKVKFITVNTHYPSSKRASVRSAVRQFCTKYPKSQGIILFTDHAIFVRPRVILDYSISKWNHVNVLLHETESENSNSWL